MRILQLVPALIMRGPLITGAFITYVLSVTSQSIGDVVLYFPWGSPNMTADDMNPSGKQRGTEIVSSPMLAQRLLSRSQPLGLLHRLISRSTIVPTSKSWPATGRP